MKRKASRRRFPVFAVVLAILASALLALACEEEEEGVTPTPLVAETPTEEATPTAAKPGDAGIPSNPRPVRGLEEFLVLDDGLAMWKERPADEDRTGVTADTIKLGRSTALSGWMAPYEPFFGPPIEALIERVNEAGGIHGRKIELITRDDKGEPPVAVQVAKELIEADKVFATFYNMGAPAHQAVHDYHVAMKVPWLYYMDASNLGMEPVTSKWDFGMQTSDVIGGMAMAQGVYQQDPNAKVFVVYSENQPDVDALEGIRFQAQKLGLEIVGDSMHLLSEVDLTPQAWEVKESGANWVIYHGSHIMGLSLVKALRETVGWKGQVAQWGVMPGWGDEGVDSTMDGTFCLMRPLKDMPEKSALWAKLEALGEEEGVIFAANVALSNMRVVEHLVRALELAGPDLTREGLIEALETGFDGSWQCSSCVAPTIYGPQDHWMSEVMQFTMWNNATKHYDVVIERMDYETSRGLGLRGNFPGLECQPPSAEYPQGTCPWKEAS